MSRLFLAVLLPPHVVEAIGELFPASERERLRAAGVMRSWVAPPALHCTVQFYGQVPQEPLIERLTSAAAASGATSARIDGDTRVLGRDALVVPVHGLDALAADVRAALRGHVAADVRHAARFWGHVTVGRLRHGAPTAPVAGRAVSAQGWRVRELHLMASADGRYRIVATAPLGNAAGPSTGT